MNKNLSIYNATYGNRLDEVDRNDASMSMGQDRFENPDNDGDDPEPDGFEIAHAIEYLGEYFLEDAIRLGYENIDEYAVEELGYSLEIPDPGAQLIEDSIPLYFSGEIN